ncbi:protein SSUH2 homolog isoform X1 [Haliotis rubra]|uniref:protein SSUH2 homolog isoform X1 n=1 Tax=Haliotis rubra TaxID=36100 RepID=UPI001EE54469|nr:protein SSUH2 homolog isoform X1 [Haliotis rubra]
MIRVRMHPRDYGHPGMPGAPPQQWTAGMGGAPPPEWRQGTQIPVDNEAAAPPSFGPPPMQGMPTFQGYENVGGFNQMAPLPPPPSSTPPPEPPKMDFGNLTSMDEGACRDAMIQFVSEHCCFGSAPAKEMKITNIAPGHALHYTLETYTEFRSTGYVSEPYRGGFVDGPENGPPPPPWAIPCNADSLFLDQQKLIEVPHTATVRPCHACDARGYNRCHRCHGWGNVRCHTCGGDGVRMVHVHEQGMQPQPCFACGGDGRRRCMTCGGDGRITCRTCDGFRNLKCYVQLKVTFKNNKDDYILERTDMPDELVKDVSGTAIFEQTLMPVWPITSYFVREINENSIRLVNQHKGGFPGARQLMQRQVLRGVPVTEVHYSWKDVTTRFWVYGNERKVYSPDYPQQCCWGCTIL